jgi:hypothetical protein
MNFREYFYNIFLERNEYGKILSWLSPQGIFHSLHRNQLHEDWALNYIEENNIDQKDEYSSSDYLMKYGWFRVSSVGKDIIIENDNMPPNSIQRNKLIDMATDYKMKSIEWARETSIRVIWTAQDAL